MEPIGPFMTTGEVAAFCGVGPHTVRRWQKRGVLLPDQVLESGHRRYSADHVAQFVAQNAERVQ